jgi:hypothetical protein
MVKLNDAAKAIIMLLEDHNLDKQAYMELACYATCDDSDNNDNDIRVSVNGLTLDFFTGSRETVQIFLVNQGEAINCMEVNLTNPQSINIIKEWIGKIQHGCN